MKRIYLESFPKAERKPFKMMRRMAKMGRMELLSIMDGQTFIGLVITVLYQDMVLLDYLAIDPEFTQKHYGSRAVQMIKERYQDRRLVLEIERPDEYAANARARERRKRFYLKNGIVETGIHIVLFGVDMELLTEGKPLTFEEYFAIYEDLLGTHFAKQVVQIAESVIE